MSGPKSRSPPLITSTHFIIVIVIVSLCIIANNTTRNTTSMLEVYLQPRLKRSGPDSSNNPASISPRFLMQSMGKFVSSSASNGASLANEQKRRFRFAIVQHCHFRWFSATSKFQKTKSFFLKISLEKKKKKKKA